MAPAVPLTVVAGGDEVARLVAQMAAEDPTRTPVVAPAAIVEALRRIDAALHARAVGPDVVVRAGAPPHEGVRPDVADAVRAAASGAARAVIAVGDQEDTIATVATVVSDPGLRRLVRLDGVIATVDAVRLATRVRAGLPIASDAELDRIAVADRVLVARAKDVTPRSLAELGHVLRSVNQVGPIVAPGIAACTLGEVLDLDAWHRPPAFGPAPVEPSPVLPSDAPRAVVCTCDEEVDAEQVEAWFDALLARHAADLLRVQGMLAVRRRPRRMGVHGVRSFLSTHAEVRHPAAPRSTASTVVVVGRGLDAAALQADFAAARR